MASTLRGPRIVVGDPYKAFKGTDWTNALLARLIFLVCPLTFWSLDKIFGAVVAVLSSYHRSHEVVLKLEGTCDAHKESVFDDSEDITPSALIGFQDWGLDREESGSGRRPSIDWSLTDKVVNATSERPGAGTHQG